MSGQPEVEHNEPDVIDGEVRAAGVDAVAGAWPYDDQLSFKVLPLPGGCIMVGTPRGRSW